MNISRTEQRILHVLALGGRILHARSDGGKVVDVACLTREGAILADYGLAAFQSLRRKRLIGSRGAPCRISWKGRRSVRAQLDNQG